MSNFINTIENLNETRKSDDIFLDYLENESYLKSGFNKILKDEVKSKIEEFSHWFNSIARIYLLKCDPEESESFIYLLLNLKKNLKSAICEINKYARNHKQIFTCNICDEIIIIEPSQNIWTTLQNHPHFEENYYDLLENGNTNCSQTTTESGDSSVEDLCEDFNKVDLATNYKESLNNNTKGLNNFKFNFVVKYDQRVEEAYYPNVLTAAARKYDTCDEYTIQRSGANSCTCLLCVCKVSKRSGVNKKINSYFIRNHVSGSKHLRYSFEAQNIMHLKAYHDFWHSQEPPYQAQQVHFIPEYVWNKCRCILCDKAISYNMVIDHIMDDLHKTTVLNILKTNHGKNDNYFLLDLQVEMYGVKVKCVPQIKEKKLDKTIPQHNRNGVADSEPEVCCFTKFVNEPKGLQLSPRYSAHLPHLKRNGIAITCKICESSFIDDVNTIKKHIQSPKHVEKSGIKMAKYKFYCEICNIVFKDEEAWDEHFKTVPSKHKNMAPSRKNNVAEYECKTCKQVIFGDEISLSRHIIERNNAMPKRKEITLPFTVKKLFKSEKFIQDQAQVLQIEANQVLKLQDKMEECCKDLESVFSPKYPKCKAYPFGSRISGLGNNYSDLDIFMDMGDMYTGDRDQDQLAQQIFVKDASKILKSFKDQFCSIYSIPGARTPIVKLHHNFTNFDCDMSFRHGLSVENTKFLKYCIDLQPITQPFILILKKWSDYCKVNDYITNYSLAIMAIYFLQLGNYLFSVKTLRKYNPSPSLIVNGWETINYTVPLEKMKQFVTPYTASLKQLLLDFFDFYAKFDYDNYVICPLLGNPISKLSFNNKPKENLPIEMTSYTQRIQNENAEQFRALTPFCIQDPFDLSHNLTKGCQPGCLKKFKKLCELSCEMLASIE